MRVSMSVGGSLDTVKWVSVSLGVSKLLEQNVAATTNGGGIFPGPPTSSTWWWRGGSERGRAADICRERSCALGCFLIGPCFCLLNRAGKNGSALIGDRTIHLAPSSSLIHWIHLPAAQTEWKQFAFLPSQRTMEPRSSASLSDELHLPQRAFFSFLLTLLCSAGSLYKVYRRVNFFDITRLC